MCLDAFLALAHEYIFNILTSIRIYSCIFIHQKTKSHIPACTFLNFSFELYMFYADHNIPSKDYQPKYSSTSSFRFPFLDASAASHCTKFFVSFFKDSSNPRI